MAMNRSLLSSKSNEWATPQAVFDELNKEFNFTLDPAATSENAKCQRFFTKEQDGLKQDWNGETVFCNPPYGREIGKWVEKCYNEHIKNNITVVMLIPARTDTTYFHEYIYNHAEIHFIKGRIKFIQNGKECDAAPFPSMIVIYKRQ